MAPFKLKFRMGSSRSTSQEHDPDPQVNEALLGTQQQQNQPQPLQEAVEASSSSSLDLADCSSLGQMSSERKLLLPPTSNSMRLGYLNQSRTPCINESLTDADADNVPTTPPPSYEHVLEENTRLSQHQRQLSLDSATPNQNSRRSSANSSRHSAAQLGAALEQLAGNGGGSICNDPDCRQNLNQNYASCSASHCSNISNGNGNITSSHSGSNHNNNNDGEEIIEGVTELELRSDNEEQLSINEFLLETEMAASPSRCTDERYGASAEGQGQSQCSDDQCAQCSEERDGEGACESAYDGDAASTSSQAASAAAVGGGHNFYDPLLNRGSYANYNEGGNASSSSGNLQGQLCQDACCTGSASGSTASRSGRRGQGQQSSSRQNNLLTPEMMSNKTSKEIYKDLAKQWGITCKMSESCRCMDCQSHYFDCDYDDNEHQKTDGGLGAGTPMFISEVMHGSGCNIL
ncbi:uncharacterized protein LOC110191631 [Drosophila serrata]|uniref:uncharacterized protein LOC110191631 n=1 Tax=Drosophila serrata TaxID=7274 RepID=UPI000A1D1A35|nr:uncharacterized protein LOC110191631 [Drosophila serrata]KAH8357729.1 hypothetical protein KR200_002417 [Drosophila serrata]